MRVRHVVLVGVVVLLAACGSSAKNGTGTGTTAPKALSTALGQGVSANEIKLGVSLSDFECIMGFVSGIRIDQEKNYQYFIDDINKHGGVNGRKIVPVFHRFCPIPDAQRLASICTKFTEDDKVFAVIGNLFDQTGNAQTCIAKRHKTPVFAYMLTQEIIDKSPPGLIVYPGATPERITSVLTSLLKDNPAPIEGKKLGILAESSRSRAVKDSVEPALKTLPVETGSTAVLQITNADTTAAQSQLDSFIERWKSEGTNALFVTGTLVASKQFVEKVRREMPDVTLLTDSPQTLGYGQEEAHDGADPNPYEGMLHASGQAESEYDAAENWQACARIYKEQSGKDAPNSSVVIPGPSGHSIDTYGSIRDACQMVGLFSQIATKAGPNLNIDTWVNAVDNYGPIRNLGGGQFASLHKGKYDIADTFRLASFDSSIKPEGNWKPLTELQNLPGS